MAEGGFGDWLDGSMRQQGVSQAQLARSLGVAESQVSRWRRAHKRLAPIASSLRSQLARSVSLALISMFCMGAEGDRARVAGSWLGDEARPRSVADAGGSPTVFSA